MKRYRVIAMDFDTTATVLAVEVKDEWDPKVRAQWLSNQAAIKTELAAQYGPNDFDRKLGNLLDIRAAPISLIAFHNHFFRQVRTAFIVGSYYPALTATCALGERVLNHLVLTMRDDYQGTSEYKRVYRRDSFDNWDVAIDVLMAWDVLLPAAAARFRQLKDIRNRTLHFNPATERDARPQALAAILLFQQIVDTQFAALGPHPWYIPNETGISFVRKDYESFPFVKRVVLPNCALVGQAHDLRSTGRGDWEVLDDVAYPEEEVGDEVFIRRFIEAHATGGRTKNQS